MRQSISTTLTTNGSSMRRTPTKPPHSSSCILMKSSAKVMTMKGFGRKEVAISTRSWGCSERYLSARIFNPSLFVIRIFNPPICHTLFITNYIKRFALLCPSDTTFFLILCKKWCTNFNKKRSKIVKIQETAFCLFFFYNYL